MWTRFFIDNLMVRIHFIIVMMRWTSLAPWEFEFPFSDSLEFTLKQVIEANVNTWWKFAWTLNPEP